MVALTFAVGVGASERIAQSVGGGSYFGLHITKNLGCLSPPPAGVEGRRNSFYVVHPATLRIGERPFCFVEVGYLYHSVHLLLSLLVL